MVSPTPIPPYRPLPTPVPRRSDPANFAARGDAFMTALPGFQEDSDAVAGAAHQNALSAVESATAAAASATTATQRAAAAATSAIAAATSAGAAQWVQGSVYPSGVVVYSPTDLLVYRRRPPGGLSTVDPASDRVGWAPASIVAPPWEPMDDAVVVALPSVHYGLERVGVQEVDMGDPADLTVGDILWVTVVNERADNFLTLNGAKVNGEVQSDDVLVLDDQFAAITCRWTGSTYGWSI